MELQEYHFSPRAKELHKVEFYWGLEPEALTTTSKSTWTRTSRVFLPTSLVDLLHCGTYALLPTISTLQALLEVHDWNCDSPFDRRALPQLEATDHSYTLVSCSSKTDIAEDAFKSAIILPIHPAYVVASSYHFFTNSDVIFYPVSQDSDPQSIEDRVRLVRELSSFYQLPLSGAVRGMKEWAPREDANAVVSPRRRNRRSMESQVTTPEETAAKEASVEEASSPLLLGLPETLPKGRVDISSYLSSTASSSVSDLSMTKPPSDQDSSFELSFCSSSEAASALQPADEDLDAYASEPCRAFDSVLKNGDTWRKVYIRLYGAPVPAPIRTTSRPTPSVPAPSPTRVTIRRGWGQIRAKAAPVFRP